MPVSLAQVSQKKKTAITDRCEGDSMTKSKKMFSPGDLAAIRRHREAKVNTVFTSKRPLQCPHIDCNRCVSICDLIAHFQHEHMEIPIVQTRLDGRNPLTFHPRDVRYGAKQCLIMLDVTQGGAGAEEGAEKAEGPPVAVAVLASRIAASQLGEESECQQPDEEETGLSTAYNDKIIIWTASNVVCSYSYTVAVSTLCEDIRVKYYGPVLQLGAKPKTLCKEGHCLILSYFHFLGMSENGHRPLNLDVIVHSED